PSLSLNASLSPVMPGRGRIGFFSQSGALGVALLETIVSRGLGLSTFVSAGNRADVSGNDLMQYWEDDPATDVLLLYIESIGNPRKFSRIARRTSRSKPIVAVRSGRSSQGIPLGHTVRATRLPAVAVDEMFTQSGVIQVDTVAQLFDVATLLTFQPLPQGRRVSVVGNSDALAVLAADACAAHELQLVGEPHTFAPTVTPEELGATLAAVVEDPAVDSVLVLFLPALNASGEEVARELARVAGRATKPIVATVLAAEGVAALLRRLDPSGMPLVGSVPAYASVEDAVRSLAAVTRYAAWRREPRGVLTELEGTDADAARELVDRVLDEAPDGTTLTGPDLTALLRCYGITLWPAVEVSTPDEAAEAASWLGYPVVLKAVAPHLMHRTDLGGVRLDLGSEGSLRRAYDQIMETLGPNQATSLVVQRMAPRGVACVVGSTEDALFGPVVSFGIGGVVTELVQDRGYRIPPLTDRDAAALVRSPRAAPLLFGYRGAEPVDVAALEELLLRVSRLSDDLPDMAELELNPVVVSPSGVAVLGARARLAAPIIRKDSDARRL
nr:acetate--CoA ligase family protein [Actinomycetes bacterium]